MGENKGDAAVCGYVLAGGASRRFGSDKALATLQGKTLVARMCRLAAAATGNARIISAPGHYEEQGFEIVEDRWPGEGPLGGIVTALQFTQRFAPGCEWNLILSCDMPFLSAEWLGFLIAHASAGNAEVVAPCSAYGLEPLCACWRTSACAALQSAFERGTRKVTDAMKLLRMEILDETHWKRFDSGGRIFWNMNTAKDYEEAVRILESEKA